MDFDLTQIYSGGTANVDLSGVFTISDDYGLSNNEVKTELIGSISKVSDKFVLEATLSAEIERCCDLCLEPLKFTFKCDLKETFVDLSSRGTSNISSENSIDNDFEDDVWPVISKMIDLKPVVLSAFYLNLPSKTVCNEQCKGLCSICGHNLNFGECGCEAYDPRKEKIYEGLRSLFQDKEV